MLSPVSHTIFNVVEMDTEVVHIHVVHIHVHVRIGVLRGGHSHAGLFDQSLIKSHLPQVIPALVGPDLVSFVDRSWREW